MELQDSWSAWFDNAQPGRSAEDYGDSLAKICSVLTIQDFWGCFNNLPALQTLPMKSGVHFMKKGVKPLWEDLTNRRGGVWHFRLRKEDGAYVWREFLVAVLSDDSFDKVGSEVTGLSLTNRPSEYLVQIWTPSDKLIPAMLGYFEGLVPTINFQSAPLFKTCASLILSNRKL